MEPPTRTTEELAGMVRDALDAADLDAYRSLLDPDVQWGPPDDSDSGCRNRDEVLAWYRRGRAKGMRAHVTETIVRGDRILVALAVSAAPPSTATPEPANRWQVLTVANGRVRDIRGFETRDDAIARL